MQASWKRRGQLLCGLQESKVGGGGRFVGVVSTFYEWTFASTCRKQDLTPALPDVAMNRANTLHLQSWTACGHEAVDGESLRAEDLGEALGEPGI